MNLAVSNISWTPDLEPDAAAILESEGITGVEIAPTAIWPSPLEATDGQIDRYRDVWAQRGIRVVAIQALLFGRPDLKVFGTPAEQKATQEYLCEMVRICARLGGSVLVFGSPRNRARGDLAAQEACDRAAAFFGVIGRCAIDAGVAFCIEPNPVAYGCDFVNTSAEGVDLVRRTNTSGFGLHLDAGGMTMAAESVTSALAAAVPFVRHFHVSEPDLKPVGSGGTDHVAFGRALRSLGYGHWISIEMRARSRESCLDDVRHAVRVAQLAYLP
jgi:D-psicose/D-tagatose/L-ribulose 3-epimerase